MRLQQYLITEAGSSRVKEISREEFIKLLPKVSDAIDSFNNNGLVLYRGDNNIHDYAIGDGHIGEPRRSANTSNYYTVLMDNLPKWDKFPKRSRSFICSTNRMSADTFGYVKLVLPFNGVKIGVVPAGDLWNAYEDKMYFYDTTGINDALETIFKSTIGIEFEFDRNWSALSNAINRVDKLSKGEIELALVKRMGTEKYTLPYEEAIKGILGRKYWKGSVLKTIESLLDPSTFKLVTSKSNNFPDSECWMEGPVLMIPDTSVEIIDRKSHLYYDKM